MRVYALMCVTMVLPILVVTLFATNINKDSLLQQKRTADLRALRNLSVSLRTMMDISEMAGQVLASDPSVQDFLRQGWPGHARGWRTAHRPGRGRAHRAGIQP